MKQGSTRDFWVGPPMTGGCRPYQNRVSPWGTLTAVATRYPRETACFGNRGCLHDDNKEVVRAFASKAWLACKLEVDRTRKVQRNDNRAFNGRRRVLFSPSLELVREGEEESSAWLVWRGSLLRWSHQGYCERISKESPLPGGSLLTPPGTIAVLSSGAIVPRVDPSADLLSAQPPGSSV